MFGKSVWDLAKPENSTSGTSWFGLGPPLVIGGGLLLLGIPLMLIWWRLRPEFFRRGRDPIDSRPPPSGGEAPGLTASTSPVAGA